MSVESDALNLAYLRYILQCHADYNADEAVVPAAKWEGLATMIENALHPPLPDSLTNGEKNNLDKMLTLATDPDHPPEIVEFRRKGVLVGRARI